MSAGNGTNPGAPGGTSDRPAVGEVWMHVVHGEGTVTRVDDVGITMDFGGVGIGTDVLLRGAPIMRLKPQPGGVYPPTTHAADYEQALIAELAKLRVRKAAQDMLRGQDEPAVPPFDAGLLVDVLARPAEPPHRVQSLMPSQAGTLVVAQRKTGKTTMELNLARCFVTGEMFLDRFTVRPIAAGARVAFLNYEVSAAQLARWADEIGVPRDRFYLVNLRGRRNPLGHRDDRARLADLLREQQVESLFVDPFGRAYTGVSQNDPGEVGAWLGDLDRFARGEVGAQDVILSAHAGWNGERTRGSTALEDWADSIITLTTDDEKARYMRAMGRDVDMDEDRLHFDSEKRWLSLTGSGSRKQAQTTRKLDDLMPAFLSVLDRQPGASLAEITLALRAAGITFQDHAVTKVANLAQDRSLVRRVSLGAGKKVQHFRLPAPTPARPLPGDGPKPPPPPP